MHFLVFLSWLLFIVFSYAYFSFGLQDFKKDFFLFKILYFVKLLQLCFRMRQDIEKLSTLFMIYHLLQTYCQFVSRFHFKFPILYEIRSFTAL